MNMFMFNGHGNSIPINFNLGSGEYIPDIVTLDPHQYIIMYKDICALSGAADIQHYLWNSVKSRTPTEFIENIQKIKTSSGVSLFEYYGSADNKVNCPNLQLSSMPNDTEIRHMGSYSLYPRYGLFSVPSNINQNNIDIIRRELKMPSYIRDSNIIHFYPYRNYESDYDFFKQNPYLEMQYNLVTGIDIEINYLHDFIKNQGNKPFILFCNVCRSTEPEYEYTTIPSKNLALLIDELRFGAKPIEAKPIRKPIVLKNLDGEMLDIKQIASDALAKNKYLKYKMKYLELKKFINNE